jgi:ParB family transcriptional regulator, chromosome partitioning protein
MTDTNPITDGAGASQPIGTLEHLDPRSLTLELNVRDVADLDAEFLASIKEHGVLVPIVAVRDEHGTVWVRAGQRRTLAAREANLSTVPVYVRPLTAAVQARPRRGSPSRSWKTTSAASSPKPSGRAAFSR